MNDPIKIENFIKDKLDDYIIDKDLIQILINNFSNNLKHLENIIEQLKLFSNIKILTTKDFYELGFKKRYKLYNAFLLLALNKKEELINMIDTYGISKIKKVFII